MSKSAGHQARKRFGQNFLHDPGVIERIVRAIHPQPDDVLVEIGPGLGALTEELLAVNPALQVVELDRDLIPVLRTKFFNYPDFRIHEADALRFDFAELAQDKPLRIVGNLPYNISTPLIFHLLEQAGVVQDMHFMLQKEVVQRLAATAGDKHYGRLGIMAQYFCQVQPLFEVGPGAFRPAPKVDSAIVRLVPHKTLPFPAKDLNLLQSVVRTAFNARRKTLRKALGSLVSADDLRALDIDDGLRPENLTLQEYVRIADFLAG
ncbi:16S rRNA (adenine(1518)-N(6)/adenine(1519)-N(6))-dimethyltransferase RsmA [Marinobacter sp. R17]|uniref:16S rRNA (adenine(1518)-N(6)/adenine(1519)-N(6))- dimethyltransferase RsmA n=1 Tax=Marinobacter TaxID=2742 RepID=UPI000F4BAB8C|nr:MULTISPECIES: 16S rRNA (adenine(1518)-N(6)/adenine(1519)-N(6))-dimethyltransferase RsmA [Marinobacter]ROT95731.1 16S rRNA (adenine(1518)-N(6)/adenine(1519)-N(6))-dimethyltransferase RsmA [Marinobacter sp. R17]